MNMAGAFRRYSCHLPLVLCGLLTVMFFRPARAAEVSPPDEALWIKPALSNSARRPGVRLGAFLLSPIVEISETYDDNVLRRDDNEVSDFVTAAKPDLALESKLSRHSLFFGAKGDLGFYKRGTQEDYKDYDLKAGGRYDIDLRTYLSAGSKAARSHFNAGTNEDNLNTSQGRILTRTQELGFVRALRSVRLKIFGRYEDADFSFGNQNAGTNEYETRRTKNLEARLSYAYTPRNNLFFSVVYDRDRYDLLGGGKRTADGWDLRTGLNFETGGLWSGGVYGGYLRRTYDDSTADATQPFIGGELIWKPDALTRVSAEVDRTFNETITAGLAGNFQTRYGLRASRIFSRRFSGNVIVGKDENEYIETAGTAPLETEAYFAAASGSYALSRTLSLGARYGYRERHSNRVGGDYRNNQIEFSLKYTR